MFLPFVRLGGLVTLVTAGALACSPSDSRAFTAVAGDLVASDSTRATGSSGASGPAATRADSVIPARVGAAVANEFGRVPVFEYHLIAGRNSVYERTHDGLRRDLEQMYQRGYRPV